MNFHQLVLNNRSQRAFDANRAITRAELESLVSLARIAPSAMNRQPLKYFLSCDEETNRVIQPMTIWARRLPELQLPPEGQLPTAFIIILVDRAIAADVKSADMDVGIAAQTMLLGAAEMGLNGCMIGSFRPELRAALGIPETLEISLVVALGKGEEDIRIVDATDSVGYYRDAAGVHYVPKRTLDELIVEGARQ
ncbi:MAG: nitroreductase family protein [Christensenellales bacterium]|jgi:nitroreductase